MLIGGDGSVLEGVVLVVVCWRECVAGVGIGGGGGGGGVGEWSKNKQHILFFSALLYYFYRAYIIYIVFMYSLCEMSQLS